MIRIELNNYFDKPFLGFADYETCEMIRNKYNIDSISVALPDKFIEHGKREFLLEKYGLDADSIYNKIIAAIK